MADQSRQGENGLQKCQSREMQLCQSGEIGDGTRNETLTAAPRLSWLREGDGRVWKQVRLTCPLCCSPERGTAQQGLPGGQLLPRAPQNSGMATPGLLLSLSLSPLPFPGRIQGWKPDPAAQEGDRDRNQLRATSSTASLSPQPGEMASPKSGTEQGASPSSPMGAGQGQGDTASPAWDRDICHSLLHRPPQKGFKMSPCRAGRAKGLRLQLPSATNTSGSTVPSLPIHSQPPNKAPGLLHILSLPGHPWDIQPWPCPCSSPIVSSLPRGFLCFTPQELSPTALAPVHPPTLRTD